MPAQSKGAASADVSSSGTEEMARASAIITSAYPPSTVTSRGHGVLTIYDVSATARFTHAIFSGNETNTNLLTDFPSRHSAAQGLNAANHFMSRNARQG